VNLSVDEDFQNQGVGTKIMLAGWGLSFRYNKKGVFLGARCPGFCKYAASLSIEEYLKLKGEDGRHIDPEIRLYRKEGFQIVKAIPNYEQDAESLNFGILMYHPVPVYGWPRPVRYLVAWLLETFGHRIFGF
jgi:ribosomal protein S18 acetylase RimI-like enzyme